MSSVRSRTTPRDIGRRCVTALLILAGVIVLLYPVAGTFYNNHQQVEFAQEHTTEVAAMPASATNAELEAAHRYNEMLAPGELRDPWGESGPTARPGYPQYLEQLGAHDAMARLRVPAIKVDQPVYHGTEAETLNRGVGHLYGTHLPVGGVGTHAVLTGHTGLADSSMFDSLGELSPGDHVFIDVAGETLAYEVDRLDVVLPAELDRVTPVAGEDLVTLVTCTPYGVNTHRLLVRAHRVPYDPGTDPGGSTLLTMDWNIQPWMELRIQMAAGAVALLFLMGCAWIVQDVRRNRGRSNPGRRAIHE